MAKHTRNSSRKPQRSKRQRWMERTAVIIMDAECNPVFAQLVDQIHEHQPAPARRATPAERAYLTAQ